MVSGKRIKLGVQVNVWSVDKYPCAGRLRNFDIRMNLCDRDCERRTVVYHRMFAEEDDLAVSR